MRRRTSSSKRAAPTAFLFTLLAAAACSGNDSSDEALRIEVVSSRPEHVTGGSALIAVTVDDEDAEPDDIEVLRGGDDVSEELAQDPDQPGRFVGLVEDLEEGETVLEASFDGHEAEVTLTNHPTTGPLFSGSPLPLAKCTTEEHGLEPSTPENGCFAPTEVTWEYVDEEGDRHDLDDPSAPPDDVEMLELGEDGDEVPFVIRTETGVLNRSVYQIVLLEHGWNQRLIYRFGGGCAGTFGQGGLGAGDPSLDVLRRGYATATATFNTFGVLCNDVISAETMSMVKEHFVVTYGEPVHTIGEGASGGAMQQLLLAQNYPGLLDGIAPSFPFPDALSTFGGVIDCRLLNRYYATRDGRDLSEDQKLAINGHASLDVCDQWDSEFVDGIVPSAGCAGDDVYDPKSNRDGFRCTFYETNVAFVGRDPETGFARSGYDNEGVQYGLDALNEGTISPNEFLDLNERVGGFDIDGQPQAARSVVDEIQVAEAYETGRVVGPWGGLPDTPVILIDVYTDLSGDFHDRVRAFSILDRFTNGAGESQRPATVSLWSMEDADIDMATAMTGAVDGLAEASAVALDEWLTAAREHQAVEGGTWQDALAAAKPKSAESRCSLKDEDPIVGPDANEDPACVDSMPVHRDPRMVAGAPRSGDVLKCQLVPVEKAVAGGMYDVELTEARVDRLAEIFPDGVCDYDQPGVGQGPPEDVWMDFSQ